MAKVDCETQAPSKFGLLKNYFQALVYICTLQSYLFLILFSRLSSLTSGVDIFSSLRIQSPSHEKKNVELWQLQG